jgi:GNAT superfamily N-acetyltransferase
MQYQIRQATIDDLAQLQAVERAAAQLFAQSPYPELADSPLNISEFDPAVQTVWAALADDAIAAFVLVDLFGDYAHIHELDVHPQHARRGLGARLLAHVGVWAQAQGLHYLTLTTFRNVPWNAPYYARLGFVEWEGDLPPDLQAILDAERAAGLDMPNRVAMRRDLGL